MARIYEVFPLRCPLCGADMRLIAVVTAPPAIKYHGYAKGQGKQSDEGVLVSAFDGMHGWFWRTRTSQDVSVTLRTNGEYRELKRME